MIELRCIDGLNTPKLICDSCGEEITDAKQAGVVFKNFMDNDEKSKVQYVHKNFVKGDCMRNAEEVIRLAGGTPGWDELGTHLAYLVSNVGLTPNDIAKRLT